jgi:O-antigen/teichoic acid export membrane protein
MTLTQKLAFNTIIQVVSKIIVTAASVIIVIYLTRYLGAEGYGQYTIVLSYLALFVVLADFGLSIYIAREVPKKEYPAEKIVGNVMGLRLILSIAVLVLACLVVIFMPYSQIIKFGVWTASVSMLFILMNEPLKGVYQVNLAMDRYSFAEIIGRIFTLILTIIFVKIHLGLIAILAAYTLGNLINLIFNVILTAKFIKIDFRFEYPFWRGIFKEAIPLGLVAISGVIYFRVGIILLSVLKSEVDVGIFGAAYKIIEILLTFPSMFLGLILPLLSQHIEENPGKFRTIFQKSFNLMLIWIMPIFILGTMMAPQIINIIGGREFESASTPLIILLIALIFSFASSSMGPVIIALGKQSELAWRNFGAIFLTVLVNLILIPRFSYNGTAGAMIISEMVLFGLSLWLVYKHLHYLPSFKILPKVIVSGAIMSLVIFLFLRFISYFSPMTFNSFSFLTRIGIFLIIFLVGAGAYLFPLYLLRGFSQKSVKEILGRE